MTIEAIRAHLGRRHATVVSLLGYAGLRPQELRELRWRHVGESTLLATAPKTNTRRSVRLLAPLASDLREWRMASGRPQDDEPVIPAGGGGQWTARGFDLWRARVFQPASKAAGRDARPYDLRHSFASLLLHEGRSVIYVARQLRPRGRADHAHLRPRHRRAGGCASPPG